MTRPIDRDSRQEPSHPPCALQAERDYHDCMARFGHASVEAHAARIFWRRLRSQHARAGA